MFCRLRQCRQILPKLNLSAILLLFLIKRAALGNLKVNFHCAHWHRFFPLKKGLSKTHQSSLTLKFFLKSPRPSLPLKRAPPLSPSPFFSWRRLAALGIVQASLTLLSFAQPFPSGDRGCANRPFNSLYAPFGSPCRGQKRCSNRYAIRLADHQRSTPAAELQFFVRG